VLPTLSHLFIGPELEGDKGHVDEFLDTSILLEGLKEATTLHVLLLNLVQQVG